MHEVKISPPLSLARCFLTQQLTLTYNTSKIEKENNVSLDIFVSGINIAR